MINLLPPQEKKQIRAAQANVLLWRYSIVTLLLAGLLAGFVAVVFIILNADRANSEAELKRSEEHSQKYRDVQQQVTAFSNDLKTAKAILQKDVRYSQIAMKIGNVIPAGITLDALTLDAATFDKPTVFMATGQSYNDALRLKKAMEESPLFNNVSLSSVSRDEKTNQVTITINATIVSTEAKKIEVSR
ncbi:MAG: hypothetical protein Q4A34_01810 [Candidatus Saccharibacteria bacterium]|nr:hypothetical protein [Candidatus Saccharibacteria bacterium]